MTLFIQNNRSILFLHVPKCGGSSIAKIFKDNGYSPTLEMRGLPPQDCLVASPQHQTCANLKPIINMDKLGDIFIMARNPYERVISEFNWHFRDITPDDRPDINEWIIESLEKASADGDYSDNHFRACVDFIDEDLPCRIFKLEDGVEFVAEFFLRDANSIGNIDIPTEKNSKNFSSPDSKLQLNSLAIQAINQFYKNDFEAFGYKPIESSSSTAMASTQPHQAEESEQKESKVETIRKWREETVDELWRKLQKEIDIIDMYSNQTSNAAHETELQQKSSIDDMKNSSEVLFNEISSKIDQSKHILKQLALSQDNQDVNMPNTRQLTDQCKHLLQAVKVNNISITIQTLNQYRGTQSKVF